MPLGAVESLAQTAAAVNNNKRILRVFMCGFPRSSANNPQISESRNQHANHTTLKPAIYEHLSFSCVKACSHRMKANEEVNIFAGSLESAY